MPSLVKTALSVLALGLLTTANANPQLTAPGIGAIPAGAENLPQCATPAFISLLTTSGCQATDVACLCGKPDLQSFLNTAVASSCPNKADQNEVRQYAANYCSSTSSSATMSATSSAAGAMGTGNGTSAGNSTTTSASYSSPTAPTSTPTTTGAAGKTDISFGSMSALVVAVGAMTWIFAEF